MKLKQPPVVITDAREALSLLCPEWNDRTSRVLRVATSTPCITVTSFSGHYDSVSSSRRFPVTPAVVQELQDKRWVQGIPMLGYTDRFNLVISELGQHEYWNTIHDVLQWEAAVALATCGNGETGEIRDVSTDSGFDYRVFNVEGETVTEVKTVQRRTVWSLRDSARIETVPSAEAGCCFRYRITEKGRAFVKQGLGALKR